MHRRVVRSGQDLRGGEQDAFAGVAALAAKRDTYVEANRNQLGFIAGAKARREAALKHLKTATDLRIEVQFAADAAYPFDDPKSAPARTEFALPPNRRFVTR